MLCEKNADFNFDSIFNIYEEFLSYDHNIYYYYSLNKILNNTVYSQFNSESSSSSSSSSSNQEDEIEEVLE